MLPLVSNKQIAMENAMADGPGVRAPAKLTTGIVPDQAGEEEVGRLGHSRHLITHQLRTIKLARLLLHCILTRYQLRDPALVANPDYLTRGEQRDPQEDGIPCVVVAEQIVLA